MAHRIDFAKWYFYIGKGKQVYRENEEKLAIVNRL